MSRRSSASPTPGEKSSRRAKRPQSSPIVRRLRAHLAARRRAAISDPGSKSAAVLVPMVESDTGLQLLCFERSTTVLEHRGEICFPGGSVDREDADVVAAALRETREELAIPAHAIEVIGLLDDVRTAASRYVITPVVGYLRAEPPIVACQEEVARTLFAPLALCAEREQRRLERTADGERYVYSYDISGDLIWGATARIIHALLAAIGAKEKDGA